MLIASSCNLFCMESFCSRYDSFASLFILFLSTALLKFLLLTPAPNRKEQVLSSPHK